MGDDSLEAVVSSVPKEQAQRVIDQVMADYVVELNRVLAAEGERMYGVDATTFMRQYDSLWQAKLSL